MDPGALIAARYRVVRLLGQGGMGRVVEAVDTASGGGVALKLPHDELAHDPDFRRRFLREAKAARALSHPHVIDVLDVLEADGTLVMVMELLDGVSLASLLRSQALDGERLGLDEIAAYLVPVLEALDHAHRAHLVHRDFKPENVLLAERSDGSVIPKLLDFGLAKALEGSGLEVTLRTATGATLGTPYYMAPEQVGGQRDLDARVDVWAAGAVLYECLTGRRAFSGKNFGQIFTAIVDRPIPPLEGVPAPLQHAVMQALTRDRATRPSSVRPLIEGLGG